MITNDQIITHVIQKDSMSCIPACLSMLTGKDQLIIDKEFIPYYLKNELTVSRYLEKHNIRTIPYYTAGIHEILNGNLYLGTVPSLQIQGLFHQIIIDARFVKPVVYDPCKGIPNKNYYVVERCDDDRDCHLQFPLRSFLIDYKIILPSRGTANGLESEDI